MLDMLQKSKIRADKYDSNIVYLPKDKLTPSTKPFARDKRITIVTINSKGKVQYPKKQMKEDILFPSVCQCFLEALNRLDFGVNYGEEYITGEMEKLGYEFSLPEDWERLPINNIQNYEKKKMAIRENVYESTVNRLLVDFLPLVTVSVVKKQCFVQKKENFDEIYKHLLEKNEIIYQS